MNQDIWTPGQTPLIFAEKANKGIIMHGVMMPSNEVSRNGVMYDWKSVRENHKNLIGRPVMYNHEIDGIGAISLGHYTESDVMTVEQINKHPKYKVLSEEISKLDYPANKELWVYEADLNPDEEKYINKIRRGDLRHVSIQLKAKDTEEKFDKNNNYYTYAYVGDIIEGSIVATPGFLATCAVLAEKYGGKKMEEDVTTTNSDVSETKLLDKEYVEKLFLNSQKDINELKEILNKIQSQLTIKEEITMPKEEEQKKEQVEEKPEEKKEQVEDEETKKENKTPDQELDADSKKDHDTEPANDVSKPAEKDHKDQADNSVVKEQAEEDEETKKEQAEESDEDDKLDNMEKIVEILEGMKSKMEAMDSRINKMESLKEQAEEDEDKKEEPMSEGLALGKITMKENVSNTDKAKALGQAVKDILRR